MQTQIKHKSLWAVLCSLGVLSGCSSLNLSGDVQAINTQWNHFTEGQLELATTPAQQQARIHQVNTLLNDGPLRQSAAVRVALLNSPSFQALLAQHWANMAAASQSGQMRNPSFSVERLSGVSELEFTRTLSIGLFELLTWPMRYAKMQPQLDAQRLELTQRVIQHITQVRQAWVNAVAAKQRSIYCQQLLKNASVNAQWSEAMQTAGHFSAFEQLPNQIHHAREQAAYAQAQHEALLAHEKLVNILGLTDEQEKQLQLPDHLPHLPEQLETPQALSNVAVQSRLDVRLAQAQFDAATKAQGFSKASSFTDMELAVTRKSVQDKSSSVVQRAHGAELTFTLPVFDWGGLTRDQMQAETLVAANRLDATLRTVSSDLRRSQSAWNTAYIAAQQYTQQVVPLQTQLLKETQLRYNGMILGTQDLLQAQRELSARWIESIQAQQQFWLADAELQTALVGLPHQGE